MTSPASGEEHDWARYLAEYHARHAGITERLLSRADDSPYGWLATAVHTVAPPGLIVDIGCGSAPSEPPARTAAGRQVRWLGVDVSIPELDVARDAGRGPLACARADALPLADGSVDIVCAAMSLHVLTPERRVLAEIARVLRPGGALVALLPTSSGGLHALLAWGRVFAALRIASVPWPNAAMIAEPAPQLSGQGLRVVAEDRRTFVLDLTGPGEVDLAIDGLYLPHHTDPDLVAARRRLRRLAPHGLRLPLALRRLVACKDRRPHGC